MVRKAQWERAHIIFHQRAPDAGLFRLQQILGTISLKGPRPSGRFLDECDEDSDAGVDEHARD
jgi:hypothetical protein